VEKKGMEPAKAELSRLSKVCSSNVQILWKKPTQNGSSGSALKNLHFIGKRPLHEKP
jgi:hypothetical protein